MFQLEGWYLLLWSSSAVVLAVLVSLIAHKMIFSAAQRFARRTRPRHWTST